MTISSSSSSTSSSSSSSSELYSSSSSSINSRSSSSSSSIDSSSSFSSSSSSEQYSSSSSSMAESSSSSSSSVDSSSSSSSSSIDSSSSSHLDNSSSKTIPFIFEKDIVSPIWKLVTYGENVYAGVGASSSRGYKGVVLKSSDRQFWTEIYTVDDVNVKALYVQDDKLYIGTSPEGKIYIMDLTDDTTTLSQEVGGDIIDFCFFKNNLYAITSAQACVYIYNVEDDRWDKFYNPYIGVVTRVLMYDDKMYLFMDGENFIYFDGNHWYLEEVSPDNISSFRNVSTEPFSHVSYSAIERSNVRSVTNFDNEDVYDIFPSLYSRGLKSATIDDNNLILGSSNYGRIYTYNNNISQNLSQIFQTDANIVNSLLNIDSGINLASMGNKLYLLQFGSISQTTTTTTPIALTTTTTTTPAIMRLIYPNGGENIEIGQLATITWTSIKGINDAVKIDLYKGEDLALTINSKTSNTGSYDWVVPGNIESGSDYKIVITWLEIGEDKPENQGSSDDSFNIVPPLFVGTTTTTTTLSTTASTTASTVDYSDCRGIPILELSENEYITDMIKDIPKGGILFATSEGRVLGCRESLVNAYLTGDRKVYAEIRDGFGNTSDTGWADFFYGLYNKIAEINSDKEIVKWHFEEKPSAILVDRLTGVFFSPILVVEQDLGFWKQLIWEEVKPDSTDITICIRSANTSDEIQLKSWDKCFTSTDSDPSSTITRSLDDINLDGKYIQFKVIMTTDAKDTTPSVLRVSITYSTKFAIYFFTIKFSLENNSNIGTGLITANITEPQNTEIKFGVADTDTEDWNDYKAIDLNKFFELSNLENVKVGIKMISYDTHVPSVGEFALLMGGQQDNLING